MSLVIALVQGTETRDSEEIRKCCRIRGCSYSWAGRGRNARVNHSSRFTWNHSRERNSSTASHRPYSAPRHFLYAIHEHCCSACHGLLPYNMNDESPSLNSREECGPAGGANKPAPLCSDETRGFFLRFYKDHLYSSISSYCWKLLICSLLVPSATTS
jgi:hypothetical protein